MFGSHCLKTYSSTIAFSSGEAAFYGILRAGVHGLGMVGLRRDLVLKVSLRTNTDSSAAKIMGSRRGVGKVRHLDVGELWLLSGSTAETWSLERSPELKIWPTS